MGIAQPPLPDDPALDSQGQRLRRLMLRHGIKPSFWAKAMGISRSHFSLMLKDKTYLSEERKIKLSTISNIPINEFIATVDWKNHTIGDLLRDPRNLEHFIGFPMDKKARTYVRKALKALQEATKEHRAQYIELQQREVLKRRREAIERMEALRERQYFEKQEVTRRQKMLEEHAKNQQPDWE
jgi:transcriptional regulator with XRE-family HTH domain